MPDINGQPTLPNVSVERNACKESDIRYTPASAVQALLSSSVAPPRDVGIIEPCAGEGAICAALTMAGYGIEFAAELREECRPKLDGYPYYIGDWFWICDEAARTELSVVTNPPFSLGHEFWVNCRSRFPYVAMLIRCNTLGSATWAEAWNNWPPTALRPLRKRPSFTGDGKTDASEYLWAVYREGDFLIDLKVV